MPNWISIELDLVGPAAEIDRFVAVAWTPRKRGGGGPLFWYHRACPPGKRDRHETDDNAWDMEFGHFRTRTQAHFSINAAWYYPEPFFKRLAKQWPRLSFIAVVNSEDVDYGGIAAKIGGRFRDFVDYFRSEAELRRRRRAAEPFQKAWQEMITRRRPWVLSPKKAWKFGPMAFDATFDDDFMFYFPSRKDMAAFRKRYRVKDAARLGKDGLVPIR